MSLPQAIGFQYSDTQAMVAEAARDFAQQFIAPNVRVWDEQQH